VVADARAISIPTQLLISGNDFVVSPGPQHAYFVQSGRPHQGAARLPGFFHDTLGEADRAPGAGRGAPLHASSASTRRLERADLADAHLVGHTRDESDRLASPLPALSPRGLYWTAIAPTCGWPAGCPTASRSATRPASIRARRSTTVYRNQPRGLRPIGKALDRAYLTRSAGAASASARSTSRS
jgi:hypothetical protein